jgi:hypothetical protein
MPMANRLFPTTMGFKCLKDHSQYPERSDTAPKKLTPKAKTNKYLYGLREVRSVVHQLISGATPGLFCSIAFFQL